jgi:hypothetical protein
MTKNDPPAKETTWGQLLSFALRQPELAKALGLLYRAHIPLNAQQIAELKDGGWIYPSLDTSDATQPYVAEWLSNTDFIRRYAARLPELTATRALFAPVLFPVVNVLPNESLYDEALIESHEYGDGFAKIVHGNQPTSADAAVGNENDLPAATDAGIQIGWDDEQVAIWHDRQLRTAYAKEESTFAAEEVPMGILGYRVDVREPGQSWQSLSTVQGTVKAASVLLPFTHDQTIEPTPVRSQGGNDKEAWLPRYFAQWRGKSLVVSDEVAYALTGGSKAMPKSALTPILPSVDLLYGKEYEFRVRLADLTGGGPGIGDTPQTAAAAPVYKTRFVRYVPPKAARLEHDEVQPPSVKIWRPLLGYPELAFAGITQKAVTDMLVSLVNKPDGSIVKEALGVSDPDVATVRIVVEAKAPTHDTGEAGEAPGELDGDYRVLYVFERPFPALKPLNVKNLDPAVPLDPDEAVELVFDYADVSHVNSMTAPAAADPQPLPIPRGRDVRLRITPLGKDTPDYFGDERARIGMTSTLTLREDPQDETGFFQHTEETERLNAIMLQPGADMTQRLAQQLDLDVKGLTFSGEPGRRVVFGASARLRHALAGDASDITFASRGELLNQWVVALRLVIDRDWTWNGIAPEGIEVRRDLGGDAPIGTVHLLHTVGPAAIAKPTTPGIDPRDLTQLVFFDAVDPHPPAGSFPTILTPKYTITPRFKGGLVSTPVTLEVRLPVASPPRQTPKIVSAGLALTPYVHDEAYSRTEPRAKSLWIEFEEPPLDPHDAFFARVLAYGPDPVLLNFDQAVNLPTPVEPGLPIDPEPIRIITPSQPEDTAGLDAMTELTPSLTSKRHFLMPLPPGVDENALELFGFWTYELRVGHSTVWSTAQARFGRPLRLTGVQHPAPPLQCLVHRRPERIEVSAPFATPVLDGKNLTSRRTGPRTQTWVLLYAQVIRADGDVHRNILLTHKPAYVVQNEEVPGMDSPFDMRDVIGLATFEETEVKGLLTELSLPTQSPLSVVAVELLPSGSQPPEDPVGKGLGNQRILRTSPLTPVPAMC